MGVWGYKIQECDTFAEVCELFREKMNENIGISDICATISEEYKDSSERYIAQLAMIYCRWMCDDLDAASIDLLKSIVDSGIDEEYWKENGADDRQIDKRRKALCDFADKILQSKNKRGDYLKAFNKSKPSVLSKGDMFYYRIGGNTFGAVVLDVLHDYYLIALSEAISKTPVSDDIMNSPLYTLAWFSDLELPNNRRIHFCSNISTGDYNGRAGGCFSDKGIEIKNYGNSDVWAHRDCSYGLKNAKMSFVCNPKNVPLSF